MVLLMIWVFCQFLVDLLVGVSLLHRTGMIPTLIRYVGQTVVTVWLLFGITLINGDCAVSGINNWSEWSLEFIFQAHIYYSNLGTVPISHDFHQFSVMRTFFDIFLCYKGKEPE